MIVRELSQLITDGSFLPELKKVSKRKAFNESSRTVTISSDVEEPNLNSKYNDNENAVQLPQGGIEEEKQPVKEDIDKDWVPQ